MPEPNDIHTRQDIEILVDRFYQRVNEDPLLAPHFKHVDWQKHLPVMYDFWASMMLGDQSYRGNPFGKHMNLKITEEHFAAWLRIFEDTVNGNFRGRMAEEIKERAKNIAGVFQHKMNLTV